MNIEERKLMQKAQKAGQFTDFAFLCKGKKIPVHKIIICAQSKVFNAACTNDFKEARSGVYDLSEYPPGIGRDDGRLLLRRALR
ncbi:BTB/POZ domain [Fusarium oxysporum f. sp. vasinfectum]|nr:BTB/POZ domain [Fusarium oxysporum f. sp. vasinfectum]